MPTLPGGVLNNPRWQALDANGAVMPSARLYSWTTGGSFATPLALYTDSALTVAHANPVVADSSGTFPEMFTLPQGYDLSLYATGTAPPSTAFRAATNVENLGQSFLTSLGTTFTTGSTGVTSPYTMLTTDNYIETTGATNPFILTLQTAATRTFPIVVQHRGTGTLRLTPSGAQTLNGVAAYFSVSAVASPNYPTLWLLPIPAGTGYIVVGP